MRSKQVNRESSISDILVATMFATSNLPYNNTSNAGSACIGKDAIKSMLSGESTNNRNQLAVQRDTNHIYIKVGDDALHRCDYLAKL